MTRRRTLRPSLPLIGRGRAGRRARLPRPSRRQAVVAALLLAVVIGGGALRARAAADPRESGRSTDEVAYGKIALFIARNGTYPYDQGSLHWPPGAPVLFAAAYRLDPEVRGGRFAEIPAGYFAQALVGTLTIPVAFGIAALLAGPAAGLLAASAVAFYPPFIYYTRELLSEPLGAFTLGLAFLVLVWASTRRSPWALALAGLVFGAAVLVRADLLFLPFLTAAVVALVLARRAGRARAAIGGVALALGAIVALVPWTALASRRAGTFVPVTTGGGPALFIGSYLPGDGTTEGMKFSPIGDETRRRIPKLRTTPDGELRQRDMLQTVAARHPQLGYSAALMKEARANVRRYALGQPIAYAGMMLRKARRMWLDYSRLGGRPRVAGVWLFHLVIVGVSLLGLVLGLVRARDPLLGIVLLALVYSTLLHTGLAVSRPRYLIPLFPPLVAGGVAGARLAIARARGSPSPASARFLAPAREG